MTCKILACGDVKGRLTQLFERVRNIQKKAGNFEMLLCVGSFFGAEKHAKDDWQMYVNGQLEAPIPTYILGPNTADESAHYANQEIDGGEICPNVTVLGKRGIFTTLSGLSIAYLSGLDGSNLKSSDLQNHHFISEDIHYFTKKAEDSNFQGVDILLTSTWPKGICNLVQPPENYNKDSGSSLISHIASVLKPRYHFVGTEGIFLERLPYRNDRGTYGKAHHITRFLGLAPVGNEEKLKYLYAFNIIPIPHISREKLLAIPPNVTNFPYNDIETSKVRNAAQPNQSSGGFFFDMINPQDQRPNQQKRRRYDNDNSGGFRDNKQRRGGRNTRQPVARGPCWFCLGNSEVEKHLVISVGLESYVALAKGGLTSEHVLIIPIDSLRKFFKSLGKECVIFERNFRSQHLQLQVVPIPGGTTNVAKETFQELGETNSSTFQLLPSNIDLTKIISEGSPFFLAEFDDGEMLLHRIHGKFPLQFGREILSSERLLNMPDRVNWKDCEISVEEATQNAQNFRKKFKAYDFNV